MGWLHAQVRTALAVAGALGRALVLPQLWCGADRWWAPHTGTIPGSRLSLPFRCPLDHVLDLEQCAHPSASLKPPRLVTAVVLALPAACPPMLTNTAVKCHVRSYGW